MHSPNFAFIYLGGDVLYFAFSQFVVSRFQFIIIFQELLEVENIFKLSQ